jgi:flagellar protein FlbD
LIILTKLGKENKEIVINAEFIEFIEEIPDTIISLSTGKKILVQEKKEEIIKKVVNYKRSILI